MILLDTDHLTVLMYPENPRCLHLTHRLAASGETIATSIVNAEEQMRGWLTEINRPRSVHQQIAAYERLLSLFAFFNQFSLIPFDVQAATEFERLRKAKVRIGSMDLKIACIALVHNAVLLSANRRDFGQVANLRLENWLSE